MVDGAGPFAAMELFRSELLLGLGRMGVRIP
jgi:hypothetical protein